MTRKKPHRTRAEKRPGRAAAGRADRSPVGGGPAGGDAIRVAIATRPALMREVLGRVLAGEAGIKVVGEASEETAIRDMLRAEKPRVLLFDFEALGPGGESMISRLRRDSPGTRFLVLATRSGAETVERVLRSGASGLVGKELDLETVLRAIRTVAAGEVWANRLVTAHALEYLAGLSDLGVARSAANGHLTQREAEIVNEVGLGLRNKEIAAKLRISEKTVHTHLNNIFRKLQMGNRIALALFAREVIQRP
jgi:DNA-binding NarL/FixJ family response regulator